MDECKQTPHKVNNPTSGIYLNPHSLYSFVNKQALNDVPITCICSVFFFIITMPSKLYGYIWTLLQFDGHLLDDLIRDLIHQTWKPQMH